MYKGRLFAAGFTGARAFPLCAPLAVLRRPLTEDELGRMAEELRTTARKDDARGRIFASAPEEFSAKEEKLPPYLALPLSIPSPRSVPSAALRFLFARPALVLAILGDEFQTGVRHADLPDHGEPIVFRAAYLANLVVAPAENGDPRFSFIWEIGKPRWLPAQDR